jgi:NADPH:quinone reductase-like Zn-dependent oxidoreductase
VPNYWPWGPTTSLLPTKKITWRGVKEITGGKGLRLTFDPMAGSFIEKLAAAAANGGIIFEYGALSTEPTPFPLFTALVNSLSIRGYILLEVIRNPSVLERARKYICDRLEDGRFALKIAKTFPLAQTVQAYQYLESNTQVGKIVISVP